MLVYRERVVCIKSTADSGRACVVLFTSRRRRGEGCGLRLLHAVCILCLHIHELRRSNTPFPFPLLHAAGALATVGALSFGILQFKRGNVAKSQLAMRMRVVAQGGTIVALVLGVLLTSSSGTKPKT